MPNNYTHKLHDFDEFLEQKEAKPKPQRSLKGALVDLNINISEEDIRKARSEMWCGYTQEG